MLKLYGNYQVLPKLMIDLDFSLISSSCVRGNENNLHQPDGVYFLGPGKSPGDGVVNLGVRYKLSDRRELFVQINNLLNRHYYTAGQLATTPYDNNGNFTPDLLGPSILTATPNIRFVVAPFWHPALP